MNRNVLPGVAETEEQSKWTSSPHTPLGLETRHSVGTHCAAFHLNRAPQTLRAWACHEDGPLRPVRVNGRLAWPVADIRRLLGVRK